MIGVLVNTGAVVIGGLLGLLFKKGISERVNKAVMGAVGLCVVYIGVSGALASEKMIVMIVSIIVGTAIGSIIRIQDGINKLGELVEKKLRKENGVSISEGFVTGTLLFCIGAMTIVGALSSAKGDHSVYFTKAVLDGISACMLACTLGIGIAMSAISVFVVQGALVLMANFLETTLPSGLLTELSAGGGIIIIGIGLNLIGITKFKIADMLPYVLITPLMYYLAIAIGL